METAKAFIVLEFLLLDHSNRYQSNISGDIESCRIHQLQHVKFYYGLYSSLNTLIYFDGCEMSVCQIELPNFMIDESHTVKAKIIYILGLLKVTQLKPK